MMSAEQFNERVWNSPEMTETQAAVMRAMGELVAKGWGCMALDNAATELNAALANIAVMKGWAAAHLTTTKPEETGDTL